MSVIGDKKAKEYIREFFKILDTQEESDGGIMFYPVYISSCRIMTTVRLQEILTELKEWAKVDKTSAKVYNTNSVYIE